MGINLKAVNKIIFLFALFVGIYGVNIRPLHTYYAVLTIAIIYSIININKYLLYLKSNTLGLLLIAVSGFYAIIIDRNAIDGSSYGVVSLRIIVECFTIAFLVASIAFSSKFDFNFIIKSLALTSYIQFAITIYMFLNLDFKAQILQETLGLAQDNLLVESYVGLFRGYGFAIGYLFAFPFVQGLIGSLSLVQLIKSNQIKTKIYYALSFIFSIILIILNARIGFVPLLMIAMTMPIIYPRLINLKKLILASLLILSCLTLVINADSFTSNEVILASIERFTEGLDLFFSNTSGENDEIDRQRELAKDYWSFPSGIHFIFGNGLRLDADSEYYTDYGFPRFIYFGGVVFSFLIYAGFFLLFYKTKKLISMETRKRDSIFLGISKKNINLTYYAVLVSYIAAQVKGEILGLNEAVRFLVIINSIVYMHFKCRAIHDNKDIK